MNPPLTTDRLHWGRPTAPTSLLKVGSFSGRIIGLYTAIFKAEKWTNPRLRVGSGVGCTYICRNDRCMMYVLKKMGFCWYFRNHDMIFFMHHGSIWKSWWNNCWLLSGNKGFWILLGGKIIPREVRLNRESLAAKLAVHEKCAQLCGPESLLLAIYVMEKLNQKNNSLKHSWLECPHFHRGNTSSIRACVFHRYVSWSRSINGKSFRRCYSFQSKWVNSLEVQLATIFNRLVYTLED